MKPGIYYEPEADSKCPNDYVMPGVRWFQYEQMRHYVRECADIMGLRDWTIITAREPDEDMPTAHIVEGAVNRTAERMSFTLWLPPKWYAKAMGGKSERQEARQTVAHELLHVKFVRIDRIIDNLFTNLGEQAHGLVKCFYVDEMEQFIDDLACIVDEALPLPVITKNPPTQKKPDGVAIRAQDV